MFPTTLSKQTDSPLHTLAFRAAFCVFKCRNFAFIETAHFVGQNRNNSGPLVVGTSHELTIVVLQNKVTRMAQSSRPLTVNRIPRVSPDVLATNPEGKGIKTL